MRRLFCSSHETRFADELHAISANQHRNQEEIRFKRHEWRSLSSLRAFLRSLPIFVLAIFIIVHFQLNKNIFVIISLQVLSLGGNLLTEVPESVGNLHQLQALTLCDNLIEVLPASIARLTNLKSLLLHKNRLRHLPRDIITLKNLVEVSDHLRPLGVRMHSLYANAKSTIMHNS